MQATFFCPSLTSGITHHQSFYYKLNIRFLISSIKVQYLRNTAFIKSPLLLFNGKLGDKVKNHCSSSQQKDGFVGNSQS